MDTYRISKSVKDRERIEIKHEVMIALKVAGRKDMAVDIDSDKQNSPLYSPL